MTNEEFKGKKVIVRTNRAGVFYGTLKEYEPMSREALITDCRQIWRWSGACSLMELSQNGVANPRDCKFTVVVPVLSVMEVIETLPATEKAIQSIENVAVWKI